MTTRHLRRFLSMAVALLCLVVCRIDTAEAVDVMVVEDAIVETSLCEKTDDMLHATHEMGWWGMPSSSVRLQDTGGRALSISKTMQRIARIHGALYNNECGGSDEHAENLRHMLQTKRFHAGYYIYYRCQMRC